MNMNLKNISIVQTVSIKVQIDEELCLLLVAVPFVARICLVAMQPMK